MLTHYLIWFLFITLRIICIYICLQPGGLLYWFRQWLGKQVYRMGERWEWLEKPLYDGLACMSISYGLPLLLKDIYFGFNRLDYLMVVCGMLVIAGNLVNVKP